MRLLDLTLPDPGDNLALDEALLLAAEEADGGEVLRFWESPTLAVVVGAGGSIAIDVNRAACEAERVPILRRASGGGTVLIGPGCLCYSLILGYDRAPGLNEIPASNRYVLGRLCRAIAAVVPDVSIAGTSDLAVQGMKFSGNAQQRKRRHFLHHGTLLHSLDVGLVSRYLFTPERQPDYRSGRPHVEFVRNLGTESNLLKQLIVSEWETREEYAPPPWDIAASLRKEKYARDEWTRRR